MATTEIEIANLALARIGVKEFLEDGEEDGPEAAVFKLVYPTTRDALLESFAWPFATKRLAVAALTYTRSGWAYAYEQPSDAVAVRGVWSGDRNAPVDHRIAWSVEANDALDGSILLTDQSAAEFIYTGRVTKVKAFPPLFVDALVWSLAREFVLAIPANMKLLPALEQKIAFAEAKAKRSALSQQQVDPPPESEFTRVRG